MKSQTKITLILLAVVVGIAAIYGLFFRADQPDNLSYRFNWKPGNAYVYELKYQTENTTNLISGLGSGASDGQAFQTQMDLRSELVLKSYGRYGDNHILGLSLRAFTEHNLTFMGEDLFPDELSVSTTFDNQEGIIELREDGSIASIRFQKDTPALFKNLVQSFVGETQVVVRNDSTTWNLKETNQNGSGPVKYSFLGREGDDLKISKNRARYDQLYAINDKQKVAPFACH